MTDSKEQYQQAIAGIYSDHHPAMMSFLWHYLIKIYDGSGLMYLLQLALFYGAIAFSLKSLAITQEQNPSVWKICVLLLTPLYPQIMIYTAEVVKDNQFAFSFIFVVSALGFYTVSLKKMPIFVTLGLLLILLYGASVKYQGQFIAIIPLIWASFLLGKTLPLFKRALIFLSIAFTFYGSMELVHKALIPNIEKNHSWQWVKLYDLAAISLKTRQDLIPEFNKRPSFSKEKLYERYSNQSVDAYIYFDDPIFQVTKDEMQMKVLWNTWALEILKHPLNYIIHRSGNMGYALLSRPGFQYVSPFLEKFLSPHTALFNTVHKVIGWIYFIFMSHLLVVFLSFIYVILALKTWGKSKSSPILLGYSLTGLAMPCCIFFLSMAGNPRYTYICAIFCYLCHVFAFEALTCKKA